MIEKVTLTQKKKEKRVKSAGWVLQLHHSPIKLGLIVDSSIGNYKSQACALFNVGWCIYDHWMPERKCVIHCVIGGSLLACVTWRFSMDSNG